MVEPAARAGRAACRPAGGAARGRAGAGQRARPAVPGGAPLRAAARSTRPNGPAPGDRAEPERSGGSGPARLAAGRARPMGGRHEPAPEGDRPQPGRSRLVPHGHGAGAFLAGDLDGRATRPSSARNMAGPGYATLALIEAEAGHTEAARAALAEALRRSELLRRDPVAYWPTFQVVPEVIERFNAGLAKAGLQLPATSGDSGPAPRSETNSQNGCVPGPSPLAGRPGGKDSPLRHQPRGCSQAKQGPCTASWVPVSCGYLLGSRVPSFSICPSGHRSPRHCHPLCPTAHPMVAPPYPASSTPTSIMPSVK